MHGWLTSGRHRPPWGHLAASPRPPCGQPAATLRPPWRQLRSVVHGPLHRWCGARGGCRGSAASRGMRRAAGGRPGRRTVSLARSRIILMAPKLEAQMDTTRYKNGPQPGSGEAEQRQNMNGKGHKPSARTRSARPAGEGRAAEPASNPEQLQRPAGQRPTGSRTDNAVATQFDFRGCPLRTVTTDGETWFVAADICAVLEHTDPSSAVSRLDDDERGGLLFGPLVATRR